MRQEEEEAVPRWGIPVLPVAGAAAAARRAAKRKGPGAATEAGMRASRRQATRQAGAESEGLISSCRLSERATIIGLSCIHHEREDMHGVLSHCAFGRSHFSSQ